MMGGPIPRRICRVQVPALVVVGEEDVLTPLPKPSVARRAAAVDSDRDSRRRAPVEPRAPGRVFPRRSMTFSPRTCNLSSMRSPALAAVCFGLATAAARAQEFTPAPGSDPLHRPLDQILDLYVRDGLVYYRALKSERGRLDRYVASLNVPAATYNGWSREQKMAFWSTPTTPSCSDRHRSLPDPGRSSAYPANSIRQIPGAFEQAHRHAAGRSVTLDEIEKTILPEFKEPRLYLALGRGAIGSGRLKSEAYTGERLEQQLDRHPAGVRQRRNMLRIDRATNQMSVTPILSWREAEFVAAYDKARPAFASDRRSSAR